MCQVPLVERGIGQVCLQGGIWGWAKKDPLVTPSTSSAGYLIIHVVQSLCGVMLMYSLVLPILHHQGLEMLRGLGLGV